ncbi:hypothetical protein DFH09DRAFT_1114145 [Mycena vulgaris]|nr:hypothetical protein DFH09DRAFT_1114145 [Mycena vulgaris]
MASISATMDAAVADIITSNPANWQPGGFYAFTIPPAQPAALFPNRAAHNPRRPEIKLGRSNCPARRKREWKRHCWPQRQNWWSFYWAVPDARRFENLIHLHFKLHGAWILPVECEFCGVRHQEKFDYARCGGRYGVISVVRYYLWRLGWPRMPTTSIPAHLCDAGENQASWSLSPQLFRFLPTHPSGFDIQLAASQTTGIDFDIVLLHVYSVEQRPDYLPEPPVQCLNGSQFSPSHFVILRCKPSLGPQSGLHTCEAQTVDLTDAAVERYRTASRAALEKEASILPARLRLDRSLLPRVAKYLTLPPSHGLSPLFLSAIGSAPKNTKYGSPLHFLELLPGFRWPSSVPVQAGANYQWSKCATSSATIARWYRATTGSGRLAVNPWRQLSTHFSSASAELQVLRDELVAVTQVLEPKILSIAPWNVTSVLKAMNFPRDTVWKVAKFVHKMRRSASSMRRQHPAKTAQLVEGFPQNELPKSKKARGMRRREARRAESPTEQEAQMTKGKRELESDGVFVCGSFAIEPILGITESNQNFNFTSR